MCQALQKQQTANATRVISNDDDSNQHEMQKFKDSRPTTPITSDGVINAAKIRLNQKRSLSRVSSCSENSLSSDRDLKLKLSRSNSEQYSNGAIDSIDTTPTNIDDDTGDNNDNEQKQHIDVTVQCETSEQPTEEVTELDKPSDETDEQSTIGIVTNIEESPEIVEIDETVKIDDTDQKNKSQVENTPNVEIIEIDIDNGSNSKMNVENYSEEKTVQNDDDVVEKEEEKEEEAVVDLKTPLDDLIKAASILNPRQFELPRELAIFPQFPGDDKGELNLFFFF